MGRTMGLGKASELIVAGWLIRNGIDIYMPFVDDKAIDFLLRTEDTQGVRYYDVQVKSVKGYNRIVGVRNLEGRHGKYILIIHYRHDKKPDEFFYLTQEQTSHHLVEGAEWGDLIFNAPEREKYSDQTLQKLSKEITEGRL